MIQIKNNEVYSDTGKMVRRLGTDSYFRRAIVGAAASTDDFEEVDAAPAYTTAEYETKVAELVRERYSADEEFALQRKALNVALNPETAKAIPTAALSALIGEFAAYNAYVEECKLRAKELLKEKAGV